MPLAGLVYAVYLQRALYETPAEHPRASTEEKALFAEQVSAEGKADIPGAEFGAWGRFGRCSSLFSVPVGAFTSSCPGCPHFSSVHGLDISSVDLHHGTVGRHVCHDECGRLDSR